MLDTTDLQSIVQDAVLTVIERNDLLQIETNPYADADGEDALKVVLVLRDQWFANDIGDPVLDMLVKVRKSLSEAGEARQPYFEFIAETELLDDGGD